MSTNNVPVIIGIFPGEKEAKEAIEALRGAGFMRDQIGVAWHQDVSSADYVNSLVSLGVVQEQAVYYDQEFRKGRPVVTVRPDGRNREAYNVLHTYGAYDYDQRDSNMPQGVNNATGTQENVTGQYATPSEMQSIPIREERLELHKQTVPAGEVRLYKDVVTEQQGIDVPVNREEVVVERFPGSGQVSDTAIGQDEILRIPLHKEQVSINKIPVETGDVVINKRIVEETQHITGAVRHEEIRVDKEGSPIIHTDGINNA